MAVEEVTLDRIRHLETALALEQQKVEAVEKKVENLFSNIAKALWIVAGSVLLSIVTFMTGGGFNVSK
jgi:hypothetical protein